VQRLNLAVRNLVAEVHADKRLCFVLAERELLQSDIAEYAPGAQSYD
jgi:hypothetical protein